MNKYTKERLFLTEQQESFFINEMQKQYGLSYNAIRKILIDYVSRYGSGNNLSDKMFMFRRFDNLLKSVSEEIQGIKNVKFQPFNAYVSKIQRLNYLYTGYKIESMHFIPLNFKPLEQKELEMAPLSKLGLRIRNKEVMNKIERTLTQSIVKAEGVGDTAMQIKRIMNEDLYKAIRIARTETTGAMSKGNEKAMEKVKSKGLDIKKQWISTLDEKTRKRHRRMDKEQRELGEKFSNGLMHPGDQRGKAEEVINCRCLMVEILNKEQDRYKELKRKARENNFNKVIENTTYEEWEKSL